MTKTLPIFEPESQEQNGSTVFVPGHPESTGAPVWVPSAVHAHTQVFGPPESNEPLTTVFVPDQTDSPTMAVFCPDIRSIPHVQVAVTAAAHEVPRRQGQREIDRIVRQFLKRIKADDIRIRRVGHTTYSWKHPIDPEPGDTGSDVRWEIKLSGLQMHMGVYDIKPFFRVVSGPFDVEKLVGVRKQILDEMEADAAGE